MLPLQAAGTGSIMEPLTRPVQSPGSMVEPQTEPGMRPGTEPGTEPGTRPGLQTSKLHHKIGRMIVLPFLLDNYYERNHDIGNDISGKSFVD